MNDPLLLRHFQQTVGLNNQPHPNTIQRILFFLLPTLFFLIVNLILIKKSLKVTEKYKIFTLPKEGPLFVIGILYVIATLIISLHAVIADAWTIKQWVLYTFVCVFGVFTIMLYSQVEQFGTKSLLAAAIVGLINTILNQWLFIEFMDINQGTPAISWKLIIRIFQGLRTVFVLIHDIQLFSQWLKYDLQVSEKHQITFFWVTGLLVFIGLGIINVILFGPFTHVIGFILGGILYFIPSFLHTLEYSKGLKK